MDNVICHYSNSPFDVYTCEVQEQVIPHDTELNFVGIHENDNTDKDVIRINLLRCKMEKIPKGLIKKFPNLERMIIIEAGLKSINRSDLVEYRNLKAFQFTNNGIEYLPGDLFADCKKLESISLYDNMLIIVEPTILDGLEHLKCVSIFGKNIHYGSIYCKPKIAQSDPKLIELKSKLLEEFMQNASLEMKTKFMKKMQSDYVKVMEFETFFQTDEILKDLCINVDGKMFLVHKSFLAIRSPFFAEILSNNPKTECLNLFDIPANIFEHILKFLYKDEFPLETNFMQLFEAVDRLKISKLREYAAEKILEKLNHENALEVLNLGNKCKHDVMKRKAFEEIKQKYPKIEFKEEWLHKDEMIEKIVTHFQKMQDMEKEFLDSVECDE